MDIGSILGSIFSGGITGIIGSIVTGISNYKLKKLEYSHQETMEELKLKTINIQTEQSKVIAQETRKTISEISDSKMREKSYETDKSTYVDRTSLKDLGIFGKIIQFLLGIVDFCRGIIRPGSTIVFEAYMFFIWITLYNMVRGFESIDQKVILHLFQSVTLLLLYVASTCVTWWFGSRPVDKFIQKL